MCSQPKAYCPSTLVLLLDLATSISSWLLWLGKPNASIGSSFSCSRILRLFATDWIAHIHFSLRSKNFRNCQVFHKKIKKIPKIYQVLETYQNKPTVKMQAWFNTWSSAYLYSLLSTWKVSSIIVVHCRQRMTNVLGRGFAVFINWHSLKHAIKINDFQKLLKF